MTTTQNDPETREEFQAQLDRLIQAAEANNVNVEGGWVSRGATDGRSDWGIEIIETQPKQSIFE
jgi:uncharacterized protein YndB with AHSA1/START domain